MKTRVFLQRYLILYALSCILGILLLSIPANADLLDNWHLRNTLPEGKVLRGITYGNGTFVAVGYDGTILTSHDGENWIERTSGTTEILSGITYGNGTFVAVGYDGTILTSPDGGSWTLRDTGTDADFHGITYGNGTFVAVGWFGTILTSSDGGSWTLRDTGTIQWLSGITYGNGTFVAVGAHDTILTSPDGESWTERSSGTTAELNAITYGNGTFVAVGGEGTILTSSDGESWTLRDTGTIQWLFGITYGNSTFLAVGMEGIILQSDPIVDIAPDIKANLSDGTVTISQSENLSIIASLNAGTFSGLNADWWVAADTPFGWHYYIYPYGWYYAPDLTMLQPAYQGALFNIGTVEVLNVTGLPPGTYVFYFAVDTIMNGQIDFDHLYCDGVVVNVSQ